MGIADHSSDIAKIILKTDKEMNIKALLDIFKMADLSKQMVNQSIDAYVKQDIELAKTVCKSDDYVDELFSKIILELTTIMKNNPANVEQSINYIFIIKYLRMADRATNIVNGLYTMLQVNMNI